MTSQTPRHAGYAGYDHRLDWLRVALPWLILSLGLGILGFHALSYSQFVSDDAYISLRYARRLLDVHGLTFTEGERVEGYSNLLWVLAVAGLGRLGFDLLVAARILGVVSSSITLMGMLWLLRPRVRPETFATAAKAYLPGAFAVFTLALSQPVAVWAVGGLEAPLFMVLLFLLVSRLSETAGRVLDAKDGLLAGGLMGLLATTRPDGAIPALALLGTTFLMRRKRENNLAFVLSAGAVLVTFVATQVLFRLVYYGALLPNTAHAKIAFSTQRIRHGLDYLESGIFFLAPVAVASVAVLAIPRVKTIPRATLGLWAVPIIAWLAYVVAVGGDFMPGHRHLAPILPLLICLAAALVAEGMARGKRWVVATTLATLACLQLSAMVAIMVPLKPEVWALEGRSMGTLLRTAFGPVSPLLAVDAAGSIPYYSGLPTLDMLGLTDRTIATRRPADFGQGWMGHELGDGKYVLDREPDLIIFGGTHGQAPIFRGGKEMVADPRFLKRYRLLAFMATHPPFTTGLYVRAEGGKIGIERAPGIVRIPGYFFAEAPGRAAQLNPQGQLVVQADAHHPARLGKIELPPGNWSARVNADFPALLRVTSVGDQRDVEVDSEMRFRLQAPTEVTLEIFPRQTPTTQILEVLFHSS